MRSYTLRVVTSAFTGHRTRYSPSKKGSVNSIYPKYRLRKPAKIFFNMRVMVLFGNKFTKVLSQHAGSECNGTHLIQCKELILKEFLIMINENRACRAQNKVFPSNKSVERSIPRYS